MNITQKVEALNEVFADDDQISTGVALVITLSAFLMALSRLDKEIAKEGLEEITKDVSETIDAFYTPSAYDA